MEDAFKFQRDVDFFLRLHRHLPDGICGSTPIGNCFYREDGEPINGGNDYVDKLKQDPEFLKKEKEVEEAVDEGKKLYFGKVDSLDEAMVKMMSKAKF